MSSHVGCSAGPHGLYTLSDGQSLAVSEENVSKYILSTYCINLIMQQPKQCLLGATKVKKKILQPPDSTDLSIYSQNIEGLLTTQFGVVSPVKANSLLSTGSSISLQACALHLCIRNMAAIKNTTLKESVWRDEGVALFKYTVKVKHKQSTKTVMVFKLQLCQSYGDQFIYYGGLCLPALKHITYGIWPTWC